MITNSAGYEKGIHFKQLRFKFMHRSYVVEFRGYRVLQLSGESASGKSLLANDLKQYEGDLGQFGTNEHVLVVSFWNREVLSMLTQDICKRYTLIVIDNIDVLLTPEIAKIITDSIFDPKDDTYWVLIGRKFQSCNFGSLVEAKMRREWDKSTNTWKLWNEWNELPEMSIFNEQGRKFL